MEGGDLDGGRSARAACDGWLCFEDEAGFTRRPPEGRTWGRRGITPIVKVSGSRSGSAHLVSVLENATPGRK
ncbi:hypothetical protein ACFQ0M_00280 [Kitasatospora aburaviensis]|uniref:Transposase n=1 Tax=Kitasatospora aburaviensis TaxID=67265 RepID=A0ABW1F2N2_9ACTN